MSNYTAFTDGAYSSTRQTMGFAFVVLKDDIKVYSEFDGSPGGTNNRAEILSVINALYYFKRIKAEEITIFSDSMYVIGTMTKSWKRNTNNDLWEILDSLAKDFDINWKHVKGHEGNKYNELCDALAVEGSHLKFENDDE